MEELDVFNSVKVRHDDTPVLLDVASVINLIDCFSL